MVAIITVSSKKNPVESRKEVMGVASITGKHIRPKKLPTLTALHMQKYEKGVTVRYFPKIKVTHPQSLTKIAETSDIRLLSFAETGL